MISETFSCSWSGQLQRMFNDQKNNESDVLVINGGERALRVETMMNMFNMDFIQSKLQSQQTGIVPSFPDIIIFDFDPNDVHRGCCFDTIRLATSTKFTMMARTDQIISSTEAFIRYLLYDCSTCLTKANTRPILVFLEIGSEVITDEGVMVLREKRRLAHHYNISVLSYLSYAFGTDPLPSIKYKKNPPSHTDKAIAYKNIMFWSGGFHPNFNTHKMIAKFVFDNLIPTNFYHDKRISYYSKKADVTYFQIGLISGKELFTPYSGLKVKPVVAPDNTTWQWKKDSNKKDGLIPYSQNSSITWVIPFNCILAKNKSMIIVANHLSSMNITIGDTKLTAILVDYTSIPTNKHRNKHKVYMFDYILYGKNFDNTSILKSNLIQESFSENMNE
jgi:hypothetical protein